MKLRDISLIAVGAVAAVVVMAAASIIFYTPRAQAQASSAVPAPGGVSMIVSQGNNPAGQVQGGTIALQDSAARKVTVLPYSYYMSTASGGIPVLEVGGASVITY